MKIIQLDLADTNFVEAAAKAGADRIRFCIQCGTCTASCPSGRRTTFQPRQLIRKTLVGLRDQVLTDKDLWLCTTCFTCLERCPRRVDPTEVILTLRRLAVETGHMLEIHKTVSNLVFKYGHAVPINDANKKLRTTLGLDELPPTTHMFEEALREVQKIAKKTGFDKLGASKHTR